MLQRSRRSLGDAMLLGPAGEYLAYLKEPYRVLVPFAGKSGRRQSSRVPQELEIYLKMMLWGSTRAWKWHTMRARLC